MSMHELPLRIQVGIKTLINSTVVIIVVRVEMAATSLITATV